MSDTIPTAFTVPLVEFTRLATERDRLRRELAEAHKWIRNTPHRTDCPSRLLPDFYQGQQIPCTCGRNRLAEK